jgi:hypothetical protein
MKAEHSTKSLAMMLEMNKWSIIYLGLMLTATGELGLFSAFVQRHPDIVWQLMSVSVASALGQVCQIGQNLAFLGKNIHFFLKMIFCQIFIYIFDKSFPMKLIQRYDSIIGFLCLLWTFYF